MKSIVNSRKNNEHMVNERNRKWINCKFAIKIVDSKSILEKDSGSLVDSDSTFLVTREIIKCFDG